MEQIAMLERRNGRNLTEQQLNVARLVAGGLTNKAIAVELGISIYTVKRHISNVMAKTGTENRAGIAAWITRIESESKPARRAQ